MAQETRHRAERRRRILEAARYFVLRHGLKAAGMEAIAREAGVAKATLYAYFPDKPAIVKALLVALLDEVRQKIAAALAADGNVVSRVAAALTARQKTMVRWRSKPVSWGPWSRPVSPGRGRLPDYSSPPRTGSDATRRALSRSGPRCAS
jgi:AcrR family transcriptional regulator